MRIAAFSDIHGVHAVYKRIPQIAADTQSECVVLGGDLLGIPDGYDTIESAQEADAKEIVSQLKRATVPIFYIMGNDDWVDLRQDSAAISSIHGVKRVYGSSSFVGYQYTLPFMGGVNERAEDTIAQDLARLESLVDQSTVLVTHGPAHGVLDYGVLERHVGSPSLRDLIQRTNPRVHIHGHTHGSFGRHGRHFNVAAAGRVRGMIIDTDTMEHEVIDESGH